MSGPISWWKNRKLLKQRITNDSLDDHREAILSRGNRFRIRFTWSRGRAVAAAILVGIFALSFLSGFFYFELYKFNNTSAVSYRLTRLIPVPVARIDGENVRFSDYLLVYRSSISIVEKQNGALENKEEDNLRKSEYKRIALDTAIDYTLALKLAKQHNLAVSDDEVEAELKLHRQIGGREWSEASFEKILRTNLDLSPSEYRRLVYLSLIKQKVQLATDTVAVNTAFEVEKLILSGETDLKKIANQLDLEFYDTDGLLAIMSLDSGVSNVAYNLSPDQISDRTLLKDNTGITFIKLIEKTDTEVSYQTITVPFLAFDVVLRDLRDNGAIKTYIEID